MYFCHNASVFVQFIWNQCQNVHFSIPYPLIWWQMWRWRRYALYRVVCMLPTFLKNYWTELHEIFRDDFPSSKDQSNRSWEWSGQRSRSRKGQKTTGPNCMKFSGMICHHPRTNRLDFGVIRSKVKVKVTKRSKTYFCHNPLSFHPIHLKPTTKCSLFKSLSSDMVTNVAFVKVCALPSAYSSLSNIFLINFQNQLILSSLHMWHYDRQFTFRDQTTLLSRFTNFVCFFLFFFSS